MRENDSPSEGTEALGALLWDAFKQQQEAYQAKLHQAGGSLEDPQTFKALKELGKDLGFQAGPIKLKPGIVADKFQRVTGGELPFEYTPKTWGKHVQELGPDIRTKNSELIGAQLLDQTGAMSPETAALRRLLQQGIPEEKLPQIRTEKLDDNLLGYYQPDANQIRVNESVRAQKSQHPEFNIAGVYGHEAQHALDFLKNPKDLSTPRNQFAAFLEAQLGQERLLPSPRGNARLRANALLDADSIQKWLEAAKADPVLFQKLPPFLGKYLQEGYSPKMIASQVKDMPLVQSALGQQIREAAGNRGFRGTDPYLIDRLQTQGHFQAPIKGEMDIPVYYLSEQQARAGGDIGAWADEFPALRKLQQQYKAPVRPGGNAEVPPNKDLLPWATAAGMAGTGAGVIYVKTQRDKAEVKAQPKAEDDDREFQQAVGTLRRYIKKR
jgi:hypothetical protein